MDWRAVCATGDLADNEMKEFPLGDGEVLVLRAGAEFFAYPPLCPHQEAQLAFGTCDGAVITCMQHLWQWDLRTGAPLGPAETPLILYPTRVADGRVYVLADAAADPA